MFSSSLKKQQQRNHEEPEAVSSEITHEQIYRELSSLKAEVRTHLEYIRQAIDTNKETSSKISESVANSYERISRMESRLSVIENIDAGTRLKKTERFVERATGIKTGILLVVSLVASALSTGGTLLVNYLTTKP